MSSSCVKREVMSNQESAEKLHRTIVEKIEKRKVHSSNFKDNNWGIDFADTQLISKFNKRFRFLLCVTEIYSKYAWVIPLKDKNGTVITNVFQEILDTPRRKPNKISKSV